MVFNLNIVDLTNVHVNKDYIFSWFLKRTTTSSKISSRIKLGLRSNSANTTSSSDLLLIF